MILGLILAVAGIFLGWLVFTGRLYALYQKKEAPKQ